MRNNSIFSRVSTLFLMVLFVSASILQARPINEALFPDDKQVKKLPPVHYVRSRDYDMQHIALDLKFDWEKEQAYGPATITLAPPVFGPQKHNTSFAAAGGGILHHM